MTRTRIAPPRTAERMALGAILGRVFDRDGRGIRDASVQLYVAGSRFAPAARRLQSAADGAFHFDRLAPGRYVAEAAAPGFTRASSDRLDVAADEVVAEVRLRLWRDGVVLSGQVLDAGGGVIAGARVRATSYARDPDGTHERREFHADTNGDGWYRLVLPTGRHKLSADADGYAPATESRELRADEKRDFALHPAARISGRVLTADGRRPVAQVRVSAKREEALRLSAVEATMSDVDGRFSLGSLVAGTFHLSAEKDGLLGATGAGIAVGATDFVDGVELLLSAAATIRGRIQSAAGRAVPGAAVTVARLGVPASLAGPAARAIADEEGRYLVEGLLPGQYRLAVSADGHASHAQPVTVTAKLDRNVTLESEAIVTGVVLKADGQPAARAWVRAVVGQPGSGADVTSQTTTDQTGRFALRRLAAGAVQLTAAHHSEVGLFGPATLMTGDRKDVTVRLGPGASVTGTAMWNDGSPLVAVNVVATNRFGDSVRMVTARTADDGSFSLRGLIPGELSVRVVPRDGSFTDTPEEGSRAEVQLALALGEARAGVELVLVRR